MACDYMIKKFPYNDPILLNAEVADIAKRNQHSFRQVQYFTDRFQCLMPDNCSLDEIEQEFLQYQVEDIAESIVTSKRVDTAWNSISQIADPATGKAKFANLSTVIKGILVIFHSNADCERIFSLLNKNKTDQRCNLSTKTVGSLMTRKMMTTAKSRVCYTSEYTTQLLSSCKSATYVSHQQASTSSVLGEGEITSTL